MDDETLIARIAAGDTDAMAEFHVRWFPQFARLATRLCGNAPDGEDVAQDAVVRVLMRAASYKPDRPARAWLLAVLVNRARDRARREDVRRARSLSAAQGDDEGASRALEVADRNPTPAERAEVREREAAVRVALARLSAAEREVILLRDYSGLSAPETAQVLGLSTEQVGGRLHRARRRLGAQLQTDWPGLFPTHEL
jgi:RNA polymerase sigma-70 factor (ECF subfamily)